MSGFTFAQTQIVSNLGGPRGVQVVDNYVYTANGDKLYRALKNETTSTPELVATGFHSLTNGYNLTEYNGSMYIPGGGASGIYGTYVLSTVPTGAGYNHNTSGSVSCAYVYNGELYYTGTNPNNNTQHELRKVTGLNSSVFVASLPVGHQGIGDITNDGSTLYITAIGTVNGQSGAIYSIDLSATTPTFQLVKGSLPTPWGIHFVDDYLYFISGLNTGYIRKVHKSGVGLVDIVGQTSMSNPRGLDIDGQDIYVACVGTNPGIYKYTDINLPAGCVPPTNITVSVNTNNTATVTWNAAPNALTYDVTYVAAGGNVNSGTTISGVSGLSTTISGLTYGDQYDVYVRTNCTNPQQSIYSNYVRFRNSSGIIYVDATATGNNDGTSWENAYTDLSIALNDVVSSSDQVWIAKGTYKPSTTGNRNESFIVYANIYGGFAGTETSLSDRDITEIHTTNETILSGDLSGDDDATVDFNDTSRDDNSYHVVEVQANHIEINGLTVQGGYADATTGNDRFGGGIFKSLGVNYFSVKNCVIKNNVALSGAALSLTSNDDSNITIDACIIEHNLANVGAGIDYHLSGSNKTFGITITNSLFNANKTADNATLSRVGNGGAAARLRAYFSNVILNTTIVNNTFVNNQSLGTNNSSSGNFPVITLSRNNGKFGDVTIANNIFWGNTENGGQVAKSIGKSSNSTDQFDNTSSVGAIGTLVVANNTDEDGFSTFPSVPTGTYVTNPNLNPAFQLSTGSYAIDTGDNSLVTTTNDLLGNQRIFNNTVDRGAFEFGSTLHMDDNVFNLRSISVFPNPATLVLNIKMKQGSFKHGVIYSIIGQYILKTESKTIDVSHLKSGLYLIKIKTEEGHTVTKRFIKR